MTKFRYLRFTSIRLLAAIFGLPISLIIICFSPLFRVRLIKLFSDRIGHYALNTELLLNALNSDYFRKSPNDIIFFYSTPGAPICNFQLHIMWKRVIPILPFSFLWSAVDRYLVFFWKDYYSDFPLKTNFEPTSGDQDKWCFLEKNKKSFLSFTPEELHRGKEELKKLKIQADNPIVCLLVRDATYMKFHMPDMDWSYQEYRDAEISSYEAAVNYLASKGYYVVRMGKHVKNKLNTNHPNVIDYANNPMRSDFMDVYLSAHCYFFISTSSGLDSLAQVFRKPLLITNFPLVDLKSWNYWALFIPKKILNLKTKSLVPFIEIYKELYLLSNKKTIMEHLKKLNWIFLGNSPDEIIEVIDEMLLMLDGKLDIDENKLQEQFWSSFPIELPYNKSCYSAIKLKISELYLKRNKMLLNP